MTETYTIDEDLLRAALTKPRGLLVTLRWREYEALCKTLQLRGDQLAAHADPHFYAVAPRTDGGWGVFCFACSREMEEYVYPCGAREADDQAPPEELYPLELPDAKPEPVHSLQLAPLPEETDEHA